MFRIIGEKLSITSGDDGYFYSAHAGKGKSFELLKDNKVVYVSKELPDGSFLLDGGKIVKAVGDSPGVIKYRILSSKGEELQPLSDFEVTKEVGI